MKNRPSDMRVQYGALAFTVTAAVGMRILLLTSRPIADRWTIPKGQPSRGLRGAEVAEREAFEEAGLTGHVVGRHPIGHYEHPKRTGLNGTVLCRVAVFPFAVDGQSDDWPEKGQRTLKWVDPVTAAEMVAAQGLAALILEFARAYRARHPERPAAIAV